MFELMQGCRDRGIEAYVEQKAQFAADKHRYSATKHHHDVGTDYFDNVVHVIAVGVSSTTALRGLKEHEQFH